ncbi:MAG: tRNA-dihydrouridine synthase [Pirellulales bacterium]|nr:tRNA-dihydrouridine synthase [Pirellulales bacterium]
MGPLVATRLIPNASPDSSTESTPSPLKLRPLWIGPVLVDPPILQAPMAGYTNFAYRQIVRELGGAGLLATEMVSARGFAWLADHEADHPDRLWGVADEPRPLAAQMWDNNPETLAAVGARLAHEFHVSVVDINFGCPVRDVVQKAQSGSYLLREPNRMGQIIERVVAACAPTPVTAKIRLGCSRDKINAIDIAQVVEDAGAAALTVHGRTAADMFRGSADWNLIAAIKPHLRQIPLIGNGDLDSPQKVVNAFRRYNVDGVMIARAALAKPWLFRQAAALLSGQPMPPAPSLSEERALLLRHFDLICERFGDYKGTQLMRKFACCYAQGRPGAREFRSRVGKTSVPHEFRHVVHEWFPRDLSLLTRSNNEPTRFGTE